MITYQLYGSGLPWAGKLISREAAFGLLASASKAPAMVVMPCKYRNRSERVWVITPRDGRTGGHFNVVATYSREAKL